MHVEKYSRQLMNQPFSFVNMKTQLRTHTQLIISNKPTLSNYICFISIILLEFITALLQTLNLYEEAVSLINILFLIAWLFHIPNILT